ncbi:MAG: polysaccharide deacetylase family protein [Firmicutes bacterium]|nr:polysaccharide deacetylase family protein [Bacillota bacterium]
MIIYIKKRFFTLAAAVLLLTAVFMYRIEMTEAESTVELPVIMYHNITEKYNMTGKYAILKTQFENDLKYIKENGYTTVSAKELIDHAQNGTSLPEKPIMITFDDGYESFYAYAYPLLREYDMKAIMSVIGAYADLHTQKEDHNLDYSHLTWYEIDEMAESGYVEIGNHTYDMHKNKGGRKGCNIKYGESETSYRKALFDDLLHLQNDLKTHIGKETEIFAYPYGAICKESVPVINDLGFKVVFTCTEKKNVLSGSSEELLHLGRFNRANGESSKAFFSRVERNEGQ